MNHKLLKLNINKLSVKKIMHLLVTSRIFCLLDQGCTLICDMLQKK
jgi:hypothetical protein